MKKFILCIMLLSSIVNADQAPIRSITPGTLNPNVTQENLSSTVCVPGYTKTIRPNSSYTTKLKKQQLEIYGYSDKDLTHYEEDHLVMLGVGGHPTDPRNLWPQERFGKYSAKVKDKMETHIHRLLCSGKITLQQAQYVFLNDWTVEYPKLLNSLK